MEKILKLFILVILLAIAVQSCKPTQTTVTQHHFVSDTLIKIKNETVQLPVKNITIIKNPCKNDSLLNIDQTIKSGKTTVHIKTEAGNLVVKTNIDSIVNSKLKEILKHNELQVETTNNIEYRTHKYWWYLLGVVVVYIAYRICRIFFPVIRFLPY